MILKRFFTKENLFHWIICKNRVYYYMEGFGEAMQETVLNNILEYNLISKGDNIVAGISGGLDSMALLMVLFGLQEELDFNIIVCHVNHGVRDEASVDQDLVRKTAEKLGLKFHTINVDMVSYGKEKGITAEEAGRELRYGFFRDVLKGAGGGKIAVAHNKNDQAETLLQRIIRGTGIDGLRGMEFKVQNIIRPILNISREEIENYLHINKIEYVVDKTNLMPIYNRNKVRLELIPYIQENFNPNIIDTLWRTSQTSNIDSNYLEKISNESYDKIVKQENIYSIILDGPHFKKIHRSIQNRIIRIGILRLIQNIQGISQYHVTSIVDMFLDSRTGKQIDLPNGLIGRVSYDDLIIEKKKASNNNDYCYDLTLGNNVIEELGIEIDLKVVEKSEFKETFNTKFIDYDKIKGKLSLRNRKNGDRIAPLGMKGSKKIKDYFIDKKIPRAMRDEIPLLVDEDNIIWIVDYSLSELYKVRDSTKRILTMNYKGGKFNA